MPEAYNPIIRNFYQLRATLMNHVDVARHDVRPETPLAVLLPGRERQTVWRALRRQGLRLPPLELSETDSLWNTLHVLKATVALMLHLQHWYALFLAFPLAFLVSWITRHRGVYFPLGLTTVGEAVICATRFSDHKESGYQWTKSEIALKVRMIVAESAGLSLEAVQPETRLNKL